MYIEMLGLDCSEKPISLTVINKLLDNIMTNIKQIILSIYVSFWLSLEQCFVS